jgi:DNA modification methylase
MAGIDIVADLIERRPTAALVPYARNARTHSAEQVSQIAGSMREFGWTYPVLIDEDDGIIAGHGRILAASKLKMIEVPVIVARGWSDAKKRAYILADNKIALNSGWDEGLLRVELSELQGDGFDLSLIGFSSLELTSIFSTQEGNTDPDDVPDAPAVPVSKLGDLWRLGDHWLICGDATDKATVERVLGGARPHLMVTDPPYGVDYDPAWRSRALKDGAQRAEGVVQNDHRADWREAWALFPGDVVYVWHGGIASGSVAESLGAVGFELRAQIIWNKSRMAIGRGHYHWKHEPCWYAVRKGTNGHWSGDRKQNTIWDIDHPRSETGHGTQKPVEAMARPMRNNSQPGDHLYEPFSGSGTTIIAGQMNKRIIHAVELSPAYVDVALKRFADFSGIAPILVETGETFEAVKGRRLEVV